MIEAQFNMFDAAVLIVMLLSTMLAFFRGFVREFLSLGAWVGAGMLTVFLFDDAANFLKPHVSQEMIAYLMGGVGTYVISLFGFSIFNSIIIRYVKSSDEIGMFDNFLGMMFGVVRGAFIISLGYLVLSLVTDVENPPEWIDNAMTKPYAQRGAVILAAIAPEYLENISSLGERMEAAIQNEENNGNSSGQLEIFEAGESLLKLDKDKGYSDSERDLIEKIIKSRD